jgi:hypothetical protein
MLEAGVHILPCACLFVEKIRALSPANQGLAWPRVIFSLAKQGVSISQTLGLARVSVEQGIAQASPSHSYSFA